jgi:pilus assembly protein Flp/PilA
VSRESDAGADVRTLPAAVGGMTLRTRTHALLGAVLRDRRGANLVEYIILVGVIALIAIAGFKTFGGQVRAKVDEQSGSVSGINGAAH